jgi:hypothetical protein
VAVDSVGSTTARISWLSPLSDGNSPLEGYRVTLTYIPAPATAPTGPTKMRTRPNVCLGCAQVQWRDAADLGSPQHLRGSQWYVASRPMQRTKIRLTRIPS